MVEIMQKSCIISTIKVWYDMVEIMYDFFKYFSRCVASLSAQSEPFDSIWLHNFWLLLFKTTTR